ncbi:unnamed protein product [Didymodactylos carnosus]|uniref:Uncharacterized protein n=1 Tax=Didymodactylos carnosus TaxID=1234261 RepID=A0A815M6D2_9BILA|nr:unnamed protein product [Didymodactylos carnosus]CAF1418744.1 unnamed protein product [Didymodactylos carnosus]CAF4205167.1 unnamed protein product [Didymodactylos carnosus]CAF4303112.1 unnamed protein product [Didymodactylos carnosus]
MLNVIYSFVQLSVSHSSMSKLDLFLNNTLCGLIIQDSPDYTEAQIVEAQLNLHKRYDYLEKIKYSEMQCSEFIKMNQFNVQPVTQMEQNFSLAYTILVYQNLYQFQVLLRLIYRVSNYYCIHVDKDAPSFIYNYAKKASECLKNIYEAPDRIHVVWSEFSTLQAERTCQIFLLENFPGWKYYMNLGKYTIKLRGFSSTY